MFEIGEKVICIHAKPINDGIFKATRPFHIEEGEIYTIAGLGKSAFVDAPIVFLKECKNIYNFCGNDFERNLYGKDVGYRACRFRKLIKKKTDISVFHEIRQKVEYNAHIYSTIPKEELEKI